MIAPRTPATSTCSPACSVAAARVLAALAEATAAGVLEPAGGAQRRVRFHHDLIREVLVEEQPVEARGRLHARIARALRARWGDDPDAPWEILATHHLEAARAGHDPEPAVACAERAAQRAAARFAYADACAHLEHALEALGLASRPTPARRTDLLLQLAMARVHAGDPDAALATLDGIVPTVRALADPLLLARLALARETVGAALGGDASNDPVSLALLRDALAALPEDRVFEGIRLRARLARRLFYARERERAERIAREALERARALGDDGLELEASMGLFWALWEPAHLAERFALVERQRALAERLGASADAVVVRLLRAACLAEAGAIRELDAMLAELEVEARAAPWVPAPTRWIIEHGRVLVLLLRGELREAETRIVDAMAGRGPAPRRADAAAVCFGQLVLVRGLQGRAEETLAGTRALAQRLGPPWQILAASVAARSGRLDEARPVLDEAAADDFRCLHRSVNWPAPGRDRRGDGRARRKPVRRSGAAPVARAAARPARVVPTARDPLRRRSALPRPAGRDARRLRRRARRARAGAAPPRTDGRAAVADRHRRRPGRSSPAPRRHRRHRLRGAVPARGQAPCACDGHGGAGGSNREPGTASARPYAVPRRAHDPALSTCERPHPCRRSSRAGRREKARHAG